MKKILLLVTTIFAFIAYVIFHHMFDAFVTQAPMSYIPTQTRTQRGSTYKDGVYTGVSMNAYYGNVQVKVTIQKSKIVDVQFLDYPQDRETSMMINSQAMPLLKTEAVQAQIAQVDVVSGATLTSQAFSQSVESALNKAKG